MGLLDLIRPKWRHSDAGVRLHAVATVGDQTVLARIAREDEDDRVREAAIAKIDDPETLTRIAITGAISSAHKAAVAKLKDQAVLARIATAAMDIRVREAAVAKLTDQAFLSAIIASSNPRPIRLAAMRALTDQPMLTKLAKDDPDAAIRAAAAGQLTDRTLLQQIALGDGDASVRLAAAGAGGDALLARIATEDPDQPNREAAVGLLEDGETLFRIVMHKMDTATDLLGDQFTVRAGQDAALAKIADQAMLAKIAATVEDQPLARAALDRLTDQALICDVLQSPHWFARQAAVKKLDDPLPILDLIARDQDLDVLETAVSHLAEPRFAAAVSDPAMAGAIEKARAALKTAAEAETKEAGGHRIITGGLPSAEKVAAHFERIVVAR